LSRTFLKKYKIKEKTDLNKTAVIDLGSNSVRMSIFSDELPLNILKAYRSTIRLSEGMTHDGVLKAEAQMRAVNALTEYKRLADAENVCRIVAVATAAVRKAKNRQEFVGLVKDATGIEIKVIDGGCEAALDTLAISRTLDLSGGVICDIGGGSSELIGISDKKSPAVSIPHGSRGICEMFFQNGESDGAYAAAQSFADGLVNELDWLDDFKGQPLVGIGGTLRALAKFDLCDSQSGAIQKHTIKAERILELIEAVKAADFEKRANMPGIGKERADIIMGGAIILKAVLKRIEPETIYVSDVGVREGVFFDLIEGHGILNKSE
jgi:exopolyphosphatase/guanosine-5'-triphosphate,3'-diphosphate pyrophosphatase